MIIRYAHREEQSLVNTVPASAAPPSPPARAPAFDLAVGSGGGSVIACANEKRADGW